MAPEPLRRRLAELAGLFLKLGTIGFGGPAVHIGLMDREVVQRRGWLTRQQFLDLVGLTNLIPGPNSTEMAVAIGFRRAGWAGLLAAGACFILPATLITVAFAWLYVRYGALPHVEPFFSGIKPAVLAIVLAALWRLGRVAMNSWQLLLIGTGVAAASVAGCDEVVVLLAGAAAGTVFLRVARHGPPPGAAAAALLLGSLPAAASAAAPAAVVAAAVPLWQLGLFFLKVGAVLYGGGYVLLAYLEGGLVQQYAWLTRQQLLDAIAVGQFTPGPILSTATFVGYLIAGGAGAAVATLAIFLPSFVFVAAVNPLAPRLRNSRWTAPALDALNAASIGLMAAVTAKLAAAFLVDWRSALIAAAAIAVSLRWNLAPAWLVVAGALAGRLLYGSFFNGAT